MNRERWLAAAAAVLLFVYAYPLWLGAVAMVLGDLGNGATALGQAFLGAIENHSTDPMQVLRRGLLPLTAGTTVALLWTYANGTLVKGLIGMTLMSLLLAVGVWIFLGVDENALNLWQNAPNTSMTSAEQFTTALAAYVTSVCEGLFTYLLVLLGLTQVRGAQDP